MQNKESKKLTQTPAETWIKEVQRKRMTPARRKAWSQILAKAAEAAERTPE